jgi:hypothetical protein
MGAQQRHPWQFAPGSGHPGLWVPLRFAGLIAGAAVAAVLLEEARPWATLPPVVLILCAIGSACVPLVARRGSTAVSSGHAP